MNGIKIIDVERELKLGATKPYIVKCSDGNRYVAKFPGNPDKYKVLINEFVCAKLAKLLKLPIPNFELATIDNIEKYHLEDIEPINGTAFCSYFVDKAANLPGYYVLTKVSNKYDSIKILIFDVLVGNNDRNPGNLLINLKNNSLLIIDHSHVFIHEALWNSRNLSELIGARIDLSKMNKFNFDNLSSCLNDQSYKSEITKFIKSIKQLKEFQIIDIIDSIPKDWSISKEEKKSLKDFLMDRISRIDEICRLLKVEGGE